MQGIIVLIIYALIMVGATNLFTKRESGSDSFHVGNRNMGTIVSAMSVAATWIWAPALFTSAEKAYSNGIAGLFWFLVPNVLCLILFIPFARKIRREMPDGITLSGYMHKKYNSEKVKRVYLFQLTALTVLSTAVQLLAGGKILSMVTGLPLWVMTIVLAVIAFSYSQISGIKASVLTDAIQMIFLLLACAVFVPWALKLNGGWSAVQLSGATGEYGSIFSQKGLEVFLGFGLPTAIGLFAGPFGDQCFWQRAFSVRKDRIGRAFGLGAVLFAVVPLSMGILGFIAAGIGFIPADTGTVNFELIKALFPAWVIIPFMFMLISGLLSTVDSNLCAIASLTTDLRAADKLDDQRKSKLSKTAMVLLLIAGILIANIPGLTVTHMFLFYCTFRASTMLPTMLTLMNVRLTANGVVSGIVSALVVGLPIFSYGTINNLSAYKTAGSLLTVLLAGVVAMLVSFISGTRKVVQNGK
jgi:Na+/proline symporter